jgi:hypothetical protein
MTVSELNDGRLLYYPHIEFPNEVWVKAALCVWDQVFRIVPASYTPNDSVEVKKAVDAGAIIDIRLSPQDLSECAVEFEAFWNDVNEIPIGMRGFETIDLYAEKVDERVVPILKALATKFKDEGAILNVSKEVADTYMLFLADTVARRRNIRKLTDSRDMFALMHYFAVQGNIGEYTNNLEAEEYTTAVTVPIMLPGGLEYCPMEQVLTFRARFCDDRAAFRETITSLASKLVSIEDQGHARELLEQFKKRLGDRNTTITKRAKDLFNEFKYSALSVGVPTSLAVVALGGDYMAPRHVGAGVVVGGVASLCEAAKSVRKQWKITDQFYYLRLNAYFGNETALSLGPLNYESIMNEFIND